MILHKHKKNRDTAIEILDTYYYKGIKKALVLFYNIRPEFLEDGKPRLIDPKATEIRIRPEKEYDKLKF